MTGQATERLGYGEALHSDAASADRGMHAPLPPEGLLPADLPLEASLIAAIWHSKAALHLLGEPALGDAFATAPEALDAARRAAAALGAYGCVPRHEQCQRASFAADAAASTKAMCDRLCSRPAAELIPEEVRREVYDVRTKLSAALKAVVASVEDPGRPLAASAVDAVLVVKDAPQIAVEIARLHVLREAAGGRLRPDDPALAAARATEPRACSSLARQLMPTLSRLGADGVYLHAWLSSLPERKAAARGECVHPSSGAGLARTSEGGAR